MSTISSSGILCTSVGRFGSLYVDDTNVHTSGKWGVIHALTTAVFTSLESGTGRDAKPIMTRANGLGTMDSMTLPAGVAIYGFFRSFQLTSGSVVAYNLDPNVDL